MMRDKHNFAGYVEYLGDEYFCTVNDYTVKMFNKSNSESLLREQYSSKKAEYISGTSEKNCSFAVLMPKGVSYNPFHDFFTRFSFGTYILVEGKQSVPDISRFDGLEFYGETINKIFNPRQAVDHSLSSKHAHDIGLKFRPSSEYSKEFEIEVDNQKAKIEYGVRWNISLAEQKNQDGSIALGSLDSVVRTKFESEQTLDILERYWQIFNNLSVFFAGRRNVDFGVRLLRKKESDLVTHIAECSFNRLAEDIYNGNRMATIQIDDLGDSIAKLFELFANEETRPLLDFLPENNKVADKIYYANVSDICTTAEREFELNKQKTKSTKLVEQLYKRLNNEIKEFRKIQVTKEEKNDKVFDVAFGAIKYIKSSLKDRIYLLYVNSLPTQNVDLEEVSIKNEIYNFVDLRNGIQHTGIGVWGDNGKFFVKLRKILYINILLRAEVDKSSAIRIVERKWGK